MARRLQRIQVNKRRFAFTYGVSWLAVKEYKRNICVCGDSIAHHSKAVNQHRCLAPDCDCREFREPKRLSFAIDRPETVNRRTMRELIKERIVQKEKP